MNANKRFKSILGVVVMATALSVSFAASAKDTGPGSREDVLASINVQDWNGAESKINMALEKHPKSAQAWYWKAQIEEHLQHKSQALDALTHAKALDPALHFASPGAITQMEQRLNGAPQSQIRQGGQIYNPSRQGQIGGNGNIQVHPNPMANGSTASLGTPYVAQAQAPKKSGWGGVVFFLLALVVIAGVIAFFVSRSRKKAAGAADQLRQDQKTALMKRALDLKNRSERLAKDVKYEDQSTGVLGRAVTDIDSAATAMIQRLKSLPDDFSVSSESSRLDMLEQHVVSAEGLFSSKSWDTAPSAVGAPAPAATQGGSQNFGRSNSGNDGGVQGNNGYQGGYQPGYQGGYAPAPVIVQTGNSGGGLFETMMAVSLIDSMNHRGGYGGDSSMARDLADERYENDRLRDQQNQGGYQGGYAPAPAQVDNSQFDLGQGANGQDDFDDSTKRGTAGGGVFDNGGSSDSSDSGGDFSDNSDSGSSDSGSSSDDSF